MLREPPESTRSRHLTGYHHTFALELTGEAAYRISAFVDCTWCRCVSGWCRLPSLIQAHAGPGEQRQYCAAVADQWPSRSISQRHQSVRKGCLFTAKGAVAALAAYARAQELADRGGSSRQRFEALFGVWQSNTVSGGIVAARPSRRSGYLIEIP